MLVLFNGVEGTILCPPPGIRGHLIMSGDIFGCHIWEKGCYWHLVVQARDAAKHLKVHSTAPTTKNYSAQMSVVLRLRNPAVLATEFLNQPAEVLLGYALEFDRC